MANEAQKKATEGNSLETLRAAINVSTENVALDSIDLVGEEAFWPPSRRKVNRRAL